MKKSFSDKYRWILCDQGTYLLKTSAPLRPRIRILFFLGLIFFSSYPLVPAQSLGSRIDEYMSAGSKLGRFSSVVLVAQKGKIVISKGYGMADYEAKIPLTPQTKFRIASLTKQFTAMSILILQERGKLKVEDPFCRYMAKCPPAWEKITVRHLLTHTSGIPNFTAFPDYAQNQAAASTVFGLMARFWDKPLDFEPGQRFAYSNSGYVLLGHLIERVSGKSYQNFLQENVFDPLKMKSSGYDPTNAILRQSAQGYERLGGEFVKTDQVHLSVSYAAGGIYSTVEDLNIWSQELLTGKLVSKQTLDSMLTPFKGSYGYGLEIDTQFGRNRIGHSGSSSGFVTYLGVYPKEKLVTIVLSNLDTAPSPVIARDLAAIVFNEKYEVPYERKAIQIDTQLYDSYVGEYERQAGRNFRVYKENGKLFLAYLGRPTIELLPESETKFFMKDFDIQFSFIKDEKGQVTHLILHQLGENIRVNKVK